MSNTKLLTTPPHLHELLPFFHKVHVERHTIQGSGCKFPGGLFFIQNLTVYGGRWVIFKDEEVLVFRPGEVYTKLISDFNYLCCESNVFEIEYDYFLPNLEKIKSLKIVNISIIYSTLCHLVKRTLDQNYTGYIELYSIPQKVSTLSESGGVQKYISTDISESQIKTHLEIIESIEEYFKSGGIITFRRS